MPLPLGGLTPESAAESAVSTASLPTSAPLLAMREPADLRSPRSMEGAETHTRLVDRSMSRLLPPLCLCACAAGCSGCCAAAAAASSAASSWAALRGMVGCGLLSAGLPRHSANALALLGCSASWLWLMSRAGPGHACALLLPRRGSLLSSAASGRSISSSTGCIWGCSSCHSLAKARCHICSLMRCLLQRVLLVLSV